MLPARAATSVALLPGHAGALGTLRCTTWNCAGCMHGPAKWPLVCCSHRHYERVNLRQRYICLYCGLSPGHYTCTEQATRNRCRRRVEGGTLQLTFGLLGTALKRARDQLSRTARPCKAACPLPALALASSIVLTSTKIERLLTSKMSTTVYISVAPASALFLAGSPHRWVLLHPLSGSYLCSAN